MSGLTQALASALSGLQANQAGISLISSNVANADTPGYTRKTIEQVATDANNTTVGVRIGEVKRALDQYVQRQLRVENSGAYYADTRARYFNQIQDIYGQPGSSSTLESVYNKFTTTLQALSTSRVQAVRWSRSTTSSQPCRPCPPARTTRLPARR